MKPNHLIILSFVLFIGYILFLVYKTFGVKDDLVAEDYYNQEIQFQQTIDQKRTTLNDSIDVVYSMNSEDIVFDFFQRHTKSTHVKGTISFLRPSAVELDQSFPFESSNGSYHILKSKLHTGLYIVKVKWMQNNKAYLKEEQIYIN